MVKIPSEAGPLVLAGVLAAAWVGSQQVQQQIATVNVTVTNNAAPQVADVSLVELGLTGTGSFVSFPNVPFGIYTLTVTATGFPVYTQPLDVNNTTINIGVNVGTGGNPIALTNGSGTATEIDFTTAVSNQSGTTAITYNAFVHDPVTSQVVASGSVVDNEANGSYNGIIPLTVGTVPLPAGTYPVTVDGDIGGVISSNVLAFNLTVSGGQLSAVVVTVLGTGTTAVNVGSVLIGSFVISPSPQGFTGVYDGNVPFGTYTVTVTGLPSPYTDFTTGPSSSPTTHSVTINMASQSVVLQLLTGTPPPPLTALALVAGTLSAASEAFRVNATPNTFRGTVSIIDVGGATLTTVTIGAGGTGTGSIPRIAARARVIHANHGTINSNTITVPALVTVALKAVLSNGSATGTGVSFRSVISGAVTAKLVAYQAQIHNSAGQPVGPINGINRNEVNGTVNLTIPFSPATIALLTPGNYTVGVAAFDSASVLISNTITVSFTITVPVDTLAGVTASVTNISQSGTQEIATITVQAQGSTGPWSGTLVYALLSSPSVVLGSFTVTSGNGTLQRIGRVGVQQSIVISQSANSTPKLELTIAF